MIKVDQSAKGFHAKSLLAEVNVGDMRWPLHFVSLFLASDPGCDHA